MTVASLRLAGRLGERRLTLIYFLEADSSGGEANTLAIDEHEPSGDTRKLLRRCRVPHGLDAAEQPYVHNFLPRGRADPTISLHYRMAWPATDARCELQPEALRPGSTIRVFGMVIEVGAPEDAGTAAWLRARGLLDDALAAAPPRTPPEARAAYVAAGTSAAGAIYGGEVGARMAERAASAAASAAAEHDMEHDELRRAQGVWRAARPALRGMAAEKGNALRPSE